MRRGDNDIWFVKCRIDWFAVNGQILAGVDKLVLFAIKFKPAALCVPGRGVDQLIVSDIFRRRSAVDNRRDAVDRLFVEIFEGLAFGVCRMIEYPLQVDVRPILADKFPVVVKAIVPSQISEF